MDIEIFSLRTSSEDLASVGSNLRNISDELAKDGFKITYKTEVDYNKQKIQKALDSSISSEHAPNMILLTNALTTKDSSSFKKLFADTIAEAEEKMQDPVPAVPKRRKKESADIPEKKYYLKKIKIFSMGDLGNGYKGYCFIYKNTRIVVLPKTTLTGKEIAKLIYESAVLATQIFDSNAESYPGGFSLIESKPPKKSLAKRFFPAKGDTKKEKMRKSVSLLACCVFLVTAALLVYNLVILPMQNSAIQSEIQTLYHGGESGGEQGGSELKTKDWDALKAVNDEIIGWINIKDTNIDYPVLWHPDDKTTSQYYLNHNYKNEYSGYGSIFVDYRCTEGPDSKNLVLHGHHMNDGSMFANLLKYGGTTGNLDFYKEAPTVTFDTPEGDGEYKIISVFKTNSLTSHGEFFNYMVGNFNSSAEFMNYVYNVRVRSLISTPVTVNENDTLLTLSTCSYEFSEFRTVVVARKVRIGEDASVDVDKASINSNAVWPDVYYSRYGGTRPKVTTFQTAYKAKQIDWYDGDFDKLSGNEIAPTAPEPTTGPNGETSPPQPLTIAPTTRYFTVKFLDFDGNVISTQKVEEGKAATPPPDPTKESDGYYNYVFKGWQLDYSKIIGDTTIAPNFEAVPINE